MSDVYGRLAIGVFFALLAAAGAAILSVVLRQMTIAEWRANHEFLETRCTVVAKEIATVEQEGRAKYRPEIRVRYEAGGRDYEGVAYDALGVYSVDESEVRRVLDRFEEGRTYPGWYDPQEPESIVLRRGYSWVAWIVPLLPASFVAVGVGGLIFQFLTWGKSQEHRSMLDRAGAEMFDEYGGATTRYPTVPDDYDATNSPGTTLQYRVPPLPQPESWLLWGLAVLWNVATAWFVSRAVLDYLEGDNDDYVYSPLLLPFVGAGAYLAYLAGKRWLSSFGTAPTIVEISDHPLYPGGRYELFVSQPGRRRYRCFRVLLACDEHATFRQGTNSRTYDHRVAEAELFRREKFSSDPARPPAERIELPVPAGAMHSFQSTHNSVRWKIVVRGEPYGWPDFEREFVVTVFPGRHGGPFG